MSREYFFWKAVDCQGKTQRGVWLGDGISEVQTRLRQEGYFPVWVRLVYPWQNTFFPSRTFRWNGFLRRLATLLEAGIPLFQALEIMTSNEEKSSPEQEQWKYLKDLVAGGSDLSEALALLYPPPSPFILAMVKVGEYTGDMGKVLAEAADELDRKQVYKQKIKAALAYPLLLTAAVILVLYILAVWVLPMYQRLFLSVGAVDLPFLTKVIFGVGQKLPLLMGGILALASAGMLFLRFRVQNHPKVYWQRYVSRVPLVGKVCRLRDLVQFCGMLERLLRAGIPLLEGLQLTEETLRSPQMSELINRLILNVRQGQRMAPLLRESGIFPQEGSAMIGIAEEAGELEKMFRYVTEIFRCDLEKELNRNMNLIGPVFTLAAAVLVALVASGVMLPIFDLSSYLE